MYLFFKVVECFVVMAIATILVAIAILSVLLLIYFIRDYW